MHENEDSSNYQQSLFIAKSMLSLVSGKVKEKENKISSCIYGASS